MDNESLEKVRRKVVEMLKDANIKQEDKVELMLNLNRLLSPENYEKDMETLRKSKI